MKTFLLIFQIVVSVALIVFILLQQRGTALGSAFGGGDSGFYSTKRGIQKKLHWLTIIFTGLFIAGGIINLLI